MVTVKNNIIKFWAGILLAQFVLFYFASRTEAVISFFSSFFEWQKRWHQNLFSSTNFSSGDILYIILVLVSVFLIWKIISSKNRIKYTVNLLILLNCFYFLYQIFWGMLYFQKPLTEKLPEKEPTLEEAKILTEKYLAICINDREKVNENGKGVFRITNIADIETQIIEAQESLPYEFGSKKTVGINSVKPSLFSKLMSYTGILGYYNPFTAEAQYNTEIPSTYIPVTIAHESAHQLGYAKEQEASFIGYLIGRASSNPEIRYSTNYFVLKQLLRATYPQDEDFEEKILKKFSPKMQADRKFEKDFAEKHQSFLDTVFEYSNDFFLKLNHQEGSITYSYFIDLMIRYERIHPNK